LGKLEIAEILRELDECRARAAEIVALLADEPALWRMIRGELKRIAQKYADDRRTTIEGPPAPVEFREEEYIIDEDAWLIVSRDGWIKRQKSFTDVAAIRVRDEDKAGWIYRARARQTVTFFTDRGIAYTLRVNEIPMTTGHGEPIQRHFSLEDNEHVVGVVCHDPRCLPEVTAAARAQVGAVQGYLGKDLAPKNGNGDGNGHAALPPPPYGVVLTAGGKVLRFALASVAPVSNRKGRVIVRLDTSFADDLVVGVEPSDGTENVCLATKSARVLIFRVREINVVAGAAKGVTAIKLDRNDRVLGFTLANKKREGLTVQTSRGGIQVVRVTKYPVSSRGGKGHGVLQRGTLAAVLHDDAVPVPPMEEVEQ
jgi:DNA gyrase subunit A